MNAEHPDLIKDQYWDHVEFELPSADAPTLPSRSTINAATMASADAVTFVFYLAKKITHVLFYEARSFNNLISEVVLK